MKKLSIISAALAALIALPAVAGQQVVGQFGDPGEPAPRAVLIAAADSGEVYLVASGGIGDEERAKMESQISRYSVRMVFSEQNGQYVVPDTISVTRRGAEVMHLDEAGPLVYAQMPPGQYGVQVSYKGVTLNRVVSIGSGRASEMHLVWPTSLD